MTLIVGRDVINSVMGNFIPRFKVIMKFKHLL